MVRSAHIVCKNCSPAGTLDTLAVRHAHA